MFISGKYINFPLTTAKQRWKVVVVQKTMRSALLSNTVLSKPGDVKHKDQKFEIENIFRAPDNHLYLKHIKQSKPYWKKVKTCTLLDLVFMSFVFHQKRSAVLSVLVSSSDTYV